MSKTLTMRPTEVLEGYNGHDILDAERVFARMAPAITLDIKARRIRWGSRSAEVLILTPAEMVKVLADEPAGGTLSVGESRWIIAGYEMARALAALLLGSAPGERYFGRGTSFRANVRALREGGW